MTVMPQESAVHSSQGMRWPRPVADEVQTEGPWS